MIFPLPHIATWQSVLEISDRSGQKIKTYIYKADIRCLFYPNEGGGVTGTFFEYTQEAVMYTEGNIIIPEGDRIINFRDNKGNLLNGDIGPYVVVLIAVVTDLSGNLDHVEYRLNK